MNDFCHIKEDKNGKFYYNEKGYLHKLNGPAVEFKSGNKSYSINDYAYMTFYEKDNKLYIFKGLLKLINNYKVYKVYGVFIKKNIINLIKEYNPKIELYSFNKEEINQLPDWIKDLVML